MQDLTGSPDPFEATLADVEMAGEDGVAIDLESAAGAQVGSEAQAAAESIEIPPRFKYVDYLKSPIVELLVGAGSEQALLTVHQGLLVSSPWFAEACAKFRDEVSGRRIELIDEDVGAVGCFLEWCYTGNYSRKVGTARELLEQDDDDDSSALDESGDQLLKHARVYTLAEKLHVPALKSLASSKIHRVNSTAKGEIAYARYIYGHTNKDDVAIRAPVANFWATRNALRSEADDEFKQLCLEFPQFGLDVLARVLDEKPKKETTKADKKHPTQSANSRKRTRN